MYLCLCVYIYVCMITFWNYFLKFLSLLWTSSNFPSFLQKWIFISLLNFANLTCEKWCQYINLHFPDYFLCYLLFFSYKKLMEWTSVKMM